jgi:hypothetical protein
VIGTSPRQILCKAAPISAMQVFDLTHISLARSNRLDIPRPRQPAV